MDDIVNEIRSLDAKIKVLNNQKRKLLMERARLCQKLKICGLIEEKTDYRDQEDLANIVEKIRKNGKISGEPL